MSEQKRRAMPKPGVLAAVLLMGLAVGILVLLGVGLLMSSLVIRGSVGVEQIRKGVPVALFLASLTGGLFAARKLEGMPLVWGLCQGAVIVGVTLLSGCLAYGLMPLGACVGRVVAALLGGAAAGILSAIRKK